MSRRNFVLLFILVLCLGVACGVLAARVLDRPTAPAEEPTATVETPEPTPEPAKATLPAIAPEDCGHPSFEHGVCVLCGYVCPHPFHDQDRHCLLCESPVAHHFVDGVCVCGAVPDIRETLLPDRFYEPCEQEGTVLNWSFETKDWDYQRDVSMNVCFYLPYEYDPGQQYNVLVLLHGLRATEESWLTTPWELSDGREIQMRWIFDRMIAERVMDPVIIVCASQYLHWGDDLLKSRYEQMAAELQNVILPYTAANFSTYAADASPEALIAAREHFALGGNSWGSYYTYDTGMAQSLPWFSSFICLSGDANSGYVAGELESPAMRDYSIDLYYAAGGDFDVARAGEEAVFYAVVPRVERLHDGENAFFHVCQGGHDWETWSIEIYNAVQLLFQ